MKRRPLPRRARALACILGLSAGLIGTAPTAQSQQEPEEEKYVERVIRTFTSGDIIELSSIPDHQHFARLIEDQAKHDGVTEAQLRATMLERGVMRYVIDLLRDGQISLTEYVNLRPDIHWVEALRMAYVGGALAMGKEFREALVGEVTSTVTKLRQGKDIVVREIAYRSSVEELGPLYAEIAYDPTLEHAPIMVLMHGDVPGTRMAAIPGGHAYARKGMFAVVPSLRGRDGSAGTHDSFGKEIYDIYDAVEYVKAHYAEYVDPTNVNITGGSGGGMDSFAAAVHFPDYFRYIVPYYGTPDTGHWLQQVGLFGKTYDEWKASVEGQGWPAGSIRLFTNIIEGLGGMPGDVPDKMMARNNVLGAINNPYSRLHAIWDQQDGAAPSVTQRIEAYAEAARSLGYTNVNLHYSKVGDPIRYLHWVTPDNATAQRFFVPPILAGTHPQPVLADAGRMVVLGYLKTERFLIWLGAGDDAVARMDYQWSPTRGEYRFRRLSSDPDVRGTLRLPNPDGTMWTITVNHQVVREDAAGAEIVVEFGLDDVVVVARTPGPPSR